MSVEEMLLPDHAPNCATPGNSPLYPRFHRFIGVAILGTTGPRSQRANGVLLRRAGRKVTEPSNGPNPQTWGRGAFATGKVGQSALTLSFISGVFGACYPSQLRAEASRAQEENSQESFLRHPNGLSDASCETSPGFLTHAFGSRSLT